MTGRDLRMGGHSHLVDYPMRGAEFKRTAVRGTVSMAMAIGKAVLRAGSRGVNPIEAICEATQDTLYGRAIPLFEGKVVDVERRTREGFAVGQAVIHGSGRYRGSELVIRFQNENLVAVQDGEVIASVPDLISVLDHETGLAITTERIRYGQRVTVLGLPTPEIMRTEAALRVWGPRAFGYDLEFVPLERRFRDYYQRYGVPNGKHKYLTT